MKFLVGAETRVSGPIGVASAGRRSKAASLACTIPVPDKNDVFGIALFRRPVESYGNIRGIILTIGDNSRRSWVLRANGTADSVERVCDTVRTEQCNRRHRYGRDVQRVRLRMPIHYAHRVPAEDKAQSGSPWVPRIGAMYRSATE